MSGLGKTRFITLHELCEQLGISKSRFYQLQKRGVFPAPQRAGTRPVFDQTLTQQCVDVVRTRIGVNGEPILFNRKPVPEPSKKRVIPGAKKHEDLIAALGSLGLSATVEQVSAALASLPNHGADMAEPALIKAVFLILKKQS